MDNIKIMFSEMTRTLYICKVNKKGVVMEKREVTENERKLMEACIAMDNMNYPPSIRDGNQKITVRRIED